MLLLIFSNLPHGKAIARLLRQEGIPAAVVAPEARRAMEQRWDYSGILTEAPHGKEIPTGDRIRHSLKRFYQERGGKMQLSTYALQINAVTREARYLGYPLRLSPSEATLLIHLLRRAPATVDTNELLSFCLPEQGATYHTLANHVSAINAKASTISGLRLIESVRGRGYRLAGGVLPPRQSVTDLEPYTTPEDATLSMDRLSIYAEELPPRRE